MSVVQTYMEFSPEQPADVDTSTLDMEDMLGDCLVQNNILQEKGNIGHKAIKLLQKRAHMLTSTANLGLRTLQDERSELERQLQGELASCQCQLMAAHVDVETWKRRTGILQLRLASLQEDVDMYMMRVQLLDSEIGKESSEKAFGTVLELTTLQQELAARLKDVSERFKAAQSAAAAAAQEADQRLKHAQAELAQAKARLKEAAHAAAAAGERADELEWRLKQQEAALAERLRLVGEAKQATEDLSEEGIRAVRDKAKLVGEELRLQVEETRKFLENERRLRRAAEAAAAEAETRLNRHLEQASADISALRQQVLEKDARIGTLEEACRQQQTKAAIDVVTSLVGDLNPPDTEPRKRPPRAAAAAKTSELAAVPEQDAAAALPKQHDGRPGEEVLGADKEREAAKKQKRGSKSKDAAAAPASTDQEADGSSAQDAQPAQEERVPPAAPAAPHLAAKQAPAPAARRQAAKAKKDAAEVPPQETGAKAKADKQPEKASRKRKVEERAAAAGDEDAKTGAQQGDESAADAAPGGRRTRPGRARASKAPYWMGGGAAEDDSAVTNYDSPGVDTSAGAGSDSEWEAATRPKQAAKRHKSASDVVQPLAADVAESKRAHKKAPGDVQAEDISEAAAEGAAEAAEAMAKPKRGRKKAVELEQREGVPEAAEDSTEAAEVAAKPKRGRKTAAEALQEEGIPEAAEPAGEAAVAAAKPKRRHRKSPEEVTAEEDGPETAAEDLPGKPAGKVRGKLVRGSRAAVNKEEAALEGEAAGAEQQAEGEPAAAEPPAKKGAQQRKAKASKVPEAAAHQHEQPEDMDVADAGDDTVMEVEQPGEGGAAAQNAQSDQTARPVHSAQESRQELASQEAQEASSKQQLAQWERSRPAGVSKIALTAVWGNERTPHAPAAVAAAAGGAADADAKGKEKENDGVAAAAAAARPELFKPVPGRSRYGSQSEANPLAALNPGVLEAAVKARGSYVSGLSAPNRGGEVAAGKRRLLPAPKPMAAVAALPRSILFGQNFQVPKLSRH